MVITVITGPPCAGKTTYAREHCTPGDIIVDFDDLAQALGSPADHDHAGHLREITAAAWFAAIREALRQHHGHQVWIIDSRPSTWRRNAYARARAHTIALTADPAELHRRASAERPASWHDRINQFIAAPATEPELVTHSDPRVDRGSPAGLRLRASPRPQSPSPGSQHRVTLTLCDDREGRDWLPSVTHDRP